MEKINYTKEQFDELLLHPLIGKDGKPCKGGYASIYVDPTNKYAVKVFDEKAIEELVEEGGPNVENIIENISSLSKMGGVLKTNNAVMLTHTFYVEDCLVGYWAELIKGGTLYQIKQGQYIPKISYSEFLEKCVLASQNVINLSKKKIIMGDLSDKNMMYDEATDTFKFIDLDAWSRNPEDLVADILEFNLDIFNEEFGEMQQIENALSFKDNEIHTKK